MELLIIRNAIACERDRRRWRDDGAGPLLRARQTAQILTEIAGRPPVACVSFVGSPRAGHGVLRWLASPRMLRGLRRDR